MIWKNIKGYNGYYQVSDTGLIRSFRNGKYGKKDKPKLLSVAKDTQGYRKVALYKKGVRKTYKVARIVAITFIPNPQNKPEVNHVKGFKGDDTVENLEWVTSKENVNHSFETGLNKVKSGFNSPASKLEIRDINNVFKLKHQGFTQTDISKMIGISQSHVSRILRKETGHFETGEVIDIKTT